MRKVNHNRLKIRVHRAIVNKGYWDSPREYGTLLMLIVSEVTKAFDETRVNRDDKLVDIASRLYDLSCKYKINLNEIPTVKNHGFFDMIKALTDALEADRIDSPFKFLMIKRCLMMVYSEAEERNYDLYSNLIKKLKLIPKIVKRNY